LNAAQQVEESLGRAGAKGDVEEHLASPRMDGRSAMILHDDPNLFVARPRDSKPVRHLAEVPVETRDRTGRVVKAHKRCEQSGVDPGRADGHDVSVATRPRQDVPTLRRSTLQQSVAKESAGRGISVRR
jgi:hypothetical protein